VLEDAVPSAAEYTGCATKLPITLVTKSLDVALLGTCRFIYDEARPYVTTMAKQEPSRYILDARSVQALGIRDCIFGKIRAAALIHADDTLTHLWLLKCARWNKLAHSDLHAPVAAPARYSCMRLAVQGPYSGANVPSPSRCAWLAPYLRVNKTREAVFVLQAGAREERSCNADFYEELKREVELLTAAYPSEQGRRPFRVEILDEIEWAMEWGRCNVS
jgi:hypothetical protein